MHGMILLAIHSRVPTRQVAAVAGREPLTLLKTIGRGYRAALLPEAERRTRTLCPFRAGSNGDQRSITVADGARHISPDQQSGEVKATWPTIF
jgi:hypothetical protein